MRIVTISRLLGVGILTLVVGASFSSAGAVYPERPVNLLVGLAPGGANDVIARALADALKEFLPQPVSVVSKTGGAASIATAEVVQTRPDGYTLLMVYAPALTISPHTNRNLPYKGPWDLQMIAGRVAAPGLLASRSNAPWKTMPEMIEYARKNPRKVRLGHSGIGGMGHLSAEDIINTTGVEITLVPFTGAATATTAVIGGHVDLTISNPTPLLGHLRAGTIRNLATMERNRLSGLPDVPTMQELGYKVGAHSTNYFVAGPKGLPKEVVQTFHSAFGKAIKTQNFQRFVRENILVVDYRDPDELARQIKSEWEFYEKFIKNIKLD